MKTPKQVSVLQIAAKAGMSEKTVRKWLVIEGVKPLREDKYRDGRTVPYYSLKAALKAVLPHKGTAHISRRRAKNAGGDAGAPSYPGLDPSTGLTWNQAKLREEALKLRRANEREAKLDAGEIMLTVDHHRIVGAIAAKLEQVPGRLQSELNLGPDQVVRLRRALDEAREAAAKEILTEGNEDHKGVQATTSTSKSKEQEQEAA